MATRGSRKALAYDLSDNTKTKANLPINPPRLVVMKNTVATTANQSSILGFREARWVATNRRIVTKIPRGVKMVNTMNCDIWVEFLHILKAIFAVFFPQPT